MTLRPTRISTSGWALAGAGLVLALSACGSNDGAAGDTAADQLPDACTTAYPLAQPPADLAEVTLRPADFPEPPVEATLCQTSSTLDDHLMTADYATEATGSEVLDGYEQALAGYEVVRADDGAGEMVTGDLGNGVFVQVSVRTGAYSVAFGTE